MGVREMHCIGFRPSGAFSNPFCVGTKCAEKTGVSLTVKGEGVDFYSRASVLIIFHTWG